jgi:hypothetical protein
MMEAKLGLSSWDGFQQARKPIETADPAGSFKRSARETSATFDAGNRATPMPSIEQRA